MSAPRRRRVASGYNPEAGTSFDVEVSNNVQGEFGGDDGVAAVLAGDQPAPGAGNASFVCTAPAGGAAVAAAIVSGASASSLRDAGATFFVADTVLAVIVGSLQRRDVGELIAHKTESTALAASSAGFSLVPLATAGSADAEGTGGCFPRLWLRRFLTRRAPIGGHGLADGEKIGDGHEVCCGIVVVGGGACPK